MDNRKKLAVLIGVIVLAVLLCALLICAALGVFGGDTREPSKQPAPSSTPAGSDTTPKPSGSDTTPKPTLDIEVGVYDPEDDTQNPGVSSPESEQPTDPPSTGSSTQPTDPPPTTGSSTQPTNPTEPEGTGSSNPGEIDFNDLLAKGGKS